MSLKKFFWSKNGAKAPYFSEILAIILLSVETNVFEIFLLFVDTNTEYKNNSILDNFLRFFFFILDDFPLAGIIDQTKFLTILFFTIH